jgi:hypothetical protein
VLQRLGIGFLSPKNFAALGGRLQLSRPIITCALRAVVNLSPFSQAIETAVHLRNPRQGVTALLAKAALAAMLRERIVI